MYMEITNDYFLNPITQSSFIHGLKNAHYLLNELERSLNKTRKYEKELLACKASHKHLHSIKEWFASDISDEKFCKTGYRYEELSKRYETLLQAYDERCSIISARDSALTRMRLHIKATYAQLAHMHKTLISVGDRYLKLRRRKRSQKLWYENKIDNIKNIISNMASAAKNARIELDEHLAQCMTTENDATKALLLAEIRKCNCLCLENLKLKTLLEDLSPRTVLWDL